MGMILRYETYGLRKGMISSDSQARCSRAAPAFKKSTTTVPQCPRSNAEGAGEEVLALAVDVNQAPNLGESEPMPRRKRTHNSGFDDSLFCDMFLSTVVDLYFGPSYPVLSSVLYSYFTSYCCVDSLMQCFHVRVPGSACERRVGLALNHRWIPAEQQTLSTR